MEYVPVSIKISNLNLPVFLSCEIIQSTYKLIFFAKIKQNEVDFCAYKAAIACQTGLQYAICKATP